MKTILIDVMLSGRFYTQLRYTKHGTPMLINGDIIEVHKEDDMRKFAEEHLPSFDWQRQFYSLCQSKDNKIKYNLNIYYYVWI